MMLVAETRDTNGVPIFGFVAPTSSPAPILCIKDVWRGISAMLDSAEADLDAGAPGPLPIKLAAGVRRTVNLAGPSGTPGTFAGFNRALAAYAKLQWRVWRLPGRRVAHRPRRARPDRPLVSALTSADSAVHAIEPVQPGRAGPAHRGQLHRPARRVPQFQLHVGRPSQPDNLCRRADDNRVRARYGGRRDRGRR